MTETPMKQCSRKEQCVHPEGHEGWLPATNNCFSITRKNKDGLSFRCKSCSSAYYQRNKDHVKERTRQYVAENKDAVRERKRKWYLENQERILAEAQQYRIENAEQIKASKAVTTAKHRDRYLQQRREHYSLNRERIRAVQRQRYAANPEHFKQLNKASIERTGGKSTQSRKAYYLANKPKIQAKQNQWRHENRHKDAAIKRRYKGRKRNAPGTHTGADIALLFKAQGGNCWWCGKPLPDNYHVDHVIALNRGGTNDAKNLCLACPSCNCSKKDKLPGEWLGRLF